MYFFFSCLLMFLVPSLGVLVTNGILVFIQLQPSKMGQHWKSICLFFLIHSLHTTGLILLVFFALPNLNILQSASVLGCLATTPAVIRLLHETKTKDKLMDTLSLCLQLSGVIAWPVVVNSDIVSWSLPIGLILTSNSEM